MHCITVRVWRWRYAVIMHDRPKTPSHTGSHVCKLKLLSYGRGVAICASCGVVLLLHISRGAIVPTHIQSSCVAHLQSLQELLLRELQRPCSLQVHLHTCIDTGNQLLP